MTDLEMAAKFREAAANVRRGWSQLGPFRHEGDPSMTRCALVHLTDITPGGVGSCDAYQLTNAAEARIGGGIPRWNDAPGRTREDVIALFEGLAHDLELRHQIASGAAAVDRGKEPTAESLAPSPIPSLEAVPV